MPRGPASLLLLVLASHCCLGSARGLFLFGQPDFSYKRSNCKPIPANLQLCHGIEYQNMRLPNLLGHETMKEVLEQAGAWIPLVMKQCHPDTKKFLCSLFAPVCLDDLDETIQPCHSLCVQVKDRCAPVMSAFGFPWPDMLECDRFPQDNDLCIPLASSDHLLPATEEGKPPLLDPPTLEVLEPGEGGGEGEEHPAAFTPHPSLSRPGVPTSDTTALVCCHRRYHIRDIYPCAKSPPWFEQLLLGS